MPISKIKTPDGSEYDLWDKAGRVYYAEGNSRDTVGHWTCSIPSITAYFNGLILAYVPKVAAGTSGTYLRINSLAEEPCELGYEYLTSRDIDAYGMVFLVYRDYGWVSFTQCPTFKVTNRTLKIGMI